MDALAMISWSGTTLTGAIAAGYVGIGIGVAAGLSRKGLPLGTALSALAVWPLLAPLLAGDAPRVRTGPYDARIADTFAALAAVVAEVGDPGIAPDGELDVLRTALARADERLGLVDKWLAAGLGADADADGPRRQAEALRQARAHAATEIEAVLAGLAELRLQIGLVTLAGQGISVRDQLAGLRSRIAALDEVSAVSRA